MNWKFWKKEQKPVAKMVCFIKYELADGYYYLDLEIPDGLSEDDIAADFSLFINELNLNRDGVVDLIKNQLLSKIPSASFKQKLENNIMYAEERTPLIKLNRRPIVGPESVFSG